MIIWCKLQRGKRVFEFGLLSWPQYLGNKCQICARFQSVHFLTSAELSSFPSDTKIIKKQALKLLLMAFTLNVLLKIYIVGKSLAKKPY